MIDNGERSSKQALMDALEAAGARFKGKDCTCPFHQDKNPSAGVYEASGVWKFKCHVCDMPAMDVYDVRAKTSGRPLKDVLPHSNDQNGNGYRHTNGNGYAPTPATPRDEPKPEPRKEPKRLFPTAKAAVDATKAWIIENGGVVENTYQYTDANREPVEVIIRRRDKDGKKSFVQFSPFQDKCWGATAPEKPWTLYRLPAVIASDRVFVVEGEKCVEALESAGFVATTSPGGAKNADSADWSPLAGKNVIIWPDNDKPGASYADAIMARLASLQPPCDCSRVNPATIEGIGDGGDVADLIENMEREDAAAVVETIASAAKPVGAVYDLRAKLEAMIAGELVACPLPYSALSHVTQALAPGTVTLLGGNAGSSKSFFMLECMAFWHFCNVNASMFALEDDVTYQLQRILAQQSGQSQMTNFAWVKKNPREALSLWDTHKKTLLAVGTRISEPQGTVTFEMASAWAEREARHGKRIIVIDPVSVLSPSTQRAKFQEEEDFINRLKMTAKNHGCSIVATIHGKKTKQDSAGYPSLDDIAGGAAYTRLAHTVLWLHFYPENVSAACKTGMVESVRDFNRHIFVAKARNGTGTGRAIAFYFDPEKLTLEERGIIRGTPRKGPPQSPEDAGNAARDAMKKKRTGEQQDFNERG